ncbi:MAG: HEAT repeat domain-containing protein [Erythrobacter sp.]|uniref:HEAT repeat domain-containing protein n=1 Tax=Erythrobacter sp. TaxID=1042 RepID=UPI0032647F47
MSQGERYLPASDFLCMILNEEVPLTGSEFAEKNVQRLIEFTRDKDTSNRDWATLFLAQLAEYDGLERPDIVAALLTAAEDSDQNVRSEAILGLAKLKHEKAPSLVGLELKKVNASMQIFEAAELLADPTLVNDLEDFQDESDEPFVDEAARRALEACRKHNGRAK